MKNSVSEPNRHPLNTVVLAYFHYRYEAELAQGFLDESGVPTVLLIDDAGGMDVGLSFVNPARLLVGLEYVERSREILEDAGVIDPEALTM
ncbi:MAG: hypothetical protein OSA24_01680 [Longimicrobiales bacterium]|nr:hypothetical protein [Longimicrobiales bacterium]